MRKFYILSLLGLLLAISAVLSISGCGNKNETEFESEENEEYDGPDKAMLFDIERTKDPATGKVPWDKMLLAMQQTEQAKDIARNSANRINALTWIERGPDGDINGPAGNSRPHSDQTAGRIRASMVDSLDPTHNTVWVGGVDGGLWKTTDITAFPATWTLVNDFLSNLAIAAICQDPRPGFQNNMYFCTGESYYNGDAVRGVGVFKSTDGGATWNFLPGTASYTYCTRILCDFQGNIYLGTRGSGLLRSIDGGSSWTNITPSGIGTNVCDLEISSTATAARLHVATGISSTSGYRYTDIPATATTASGWVAATTPYTTVNERTELAVSGNNLIALPNNSSNQVPVIWKSTDGGANWASTTGQPVANWASGQGWYSLSAAFNPANANEFIVGGLDCHKTTDGGATWTKISAWVGSSPSLQYVHADQHNIQWWDGGNKLMFNSDGGVFYSSDGGTTIRDRNKGLRLKQFYSIAIHPTETNYFLAGAQDNGVHKLNHAGMDSSIEVTGGDGCFVAIDQNEPQYQFGSYVYNVYRRSTNNGVSWSTPINNQSTGRFVNPWDYDNNANIIYACNSAGNYFRWNNPQTGNLTDVIPLAAFNGGNVSAVHASPYTANRVYFGTGSGRVVMTDDANTASPVGTNITPSGGSGYVNCVVTGSSDQHLIACYSNYGVMNVWVSSDGGTTWSGIDGNLPNMPVYWALFHPDTDTKAYIATETGVWETDLINGSSTVWNVNPTFPNVRTDMIKYRSSDRTIAAATHGRGIWTTTVPLPSSFSFSNPAPATATCPAPASMAITLGTVSNGGFTNPVTLSATGNPVGTSVNFSPNPVIPGNNTIATLTGTTALAPGSYTITVTGVAAGAPNQAVDLTYTINPGAGPAITTQPSNQTGCSGDNTSFTIVSATATQFQWQVSINGGSTWSNVAGATTAVYSITGITAGLNGNQYRCIASTQCGSTNSNAATLTVNTAPAITTQPQDASACTGGNTSFSVSATGSALSYQWQLSTDGGGTYNNIGGATTASYSITGATAGMNGNRYRCVVSGICTPSPVITNGVILTVVATLSVTSQPANVIACVGDNPVFTVAATGSGITYQWQVSTDGGSTYNNITGATAATYSFSGVTAAQNANRYRCNISSPCGSATSNAALLTVNTLPAVTAQPSDVNICAGSSATFSITATGTGITYQWQVSTNGGSSYSDITGETSFSYTIPAVSLAMNNNRYRCVVSGACSPATTSNAAILTTATSIVITTNPSNSTICEGTNTSFTSAATGSGLNYQWQVSTDGGTNYTAVTNGGVYAGATTATLSITAAIPGMNGNKYRVYITNASCSPSTSSAATLTVNTYPQITGQPQNGIICEGANRTFSVAATTGVGVLSYQWQVSTNGGSTWNSINGATSTTLALTQVTVGANGYKYRVIVTAGCGSVTSNAVTLTVNALPVITFNAPAVICASDPAVNLVASPGGGSFSGNGLSGSSFAPAAAGIGAAAITYTATNAGCVSTATRTILVNACTERHLTLEQYSSIIVYPNPTTGKFKIKINTDLYTNLNLKAYNNDGQLVKSQLFNNISYGNILSVDMTNYPAGTYHLYLTNNENGKTSKSVSLVITK